MSHYAGWVLDKLGRPTNKVIFVKRLSKDGSLYSWVRERFFFDGNHFMKSDKTGSVMLKVSNSIFRKKVCNIQIVDVDTGEVLNMNGSHGMYLTPQELDALLTSADVKAVTKSGAFSLDSMSIIIFALGLVLGLFVGVLVFPQLLSAMGVSWW